jgi:hypothetical protein
MESLIWRELIAEFQKEEHAYFSFRHEVGIRRELILNDLIH